MDPLAIANEDGVLVGRININGITRGALGHNHGFHRVLTHNGFTRYGRALGYLKIDGRWQDHLMYQVLCTDGSKEYDHE